MIPYTHVWNTANWHLDINFSSAVPLLFHPWIPHVVSLEYVAWYHIHDIPIHHISYIVIMIIVKFHNLHVHNQYLQSNGYRDDVRHGIIKKRHVVRKVQSCYDQISRWEQAIIFIGYHMSWHDMIWHDHEHERWHNMATWCTRIWNNRKIYDIFLLPESWHLQHFLHINQQTISFLYVHVKL